MLFQYQGSEYELRDQQYNKKSSELQEVTTKTDIVQFYEEMQFDAISYNFVYSNNLIYSHHGQNTLPIHSLLHASSHSSHMQITLLMHIIA